MKLQNRLIMSLNSFEIVLKTIKDINYFECKFILIFYPNFEINCS